MAAAAAAAAAEEEEEEDAALIPFIARNSEPGGSSKRSIPVRREGGKDISLPPPLQSFLLHVRV